MHKYLICTLCIIEIVAKIINAAFFMIESFLFLSQCNSTLMSIEDLKDLKTILLSQESTESCTLFTTSCSRQMFIYPLIPYKS